jgi:GGDEF domain-containing protein
MYRFHLWVAAAILWLFALYNVERLHAPINLASFVYVFSAAGALAVLLIPGLRKLGAHWLYLLPLPFFFLLKHALGYNIGGTSLPLTVTEICAIEISIALARRLVLELEELSETVAAAMVGNLRDASVPFEVGQSEIYREMRRARRHQRPLALLSIGLPDGAMSVSSPRLLEQLQRENLRRYATAQLAHLLSDEADDSDLIARRGDHFVTLLPEATYEEASLFAKRLQTHAANQLGLRLHVGVATFPDREVTFEKLVETAEAEMQAQAASEQDRERARVRRSAAREGEITLASR